MMAAMPPMNADPALAPYLRALEAQVMDLQKNLARALQANANSNKIENGTIKAFGGVIASIEEGIPAAIDTALDTASFDMAQVSTGDLDQARVTGTWDKAVSTASTVRGNAGLASTSIYNNALSSSFRAVYTTSVDGALGYVPSSRRFKEDITTVSFDDPLIALAIRLVTFRYMEAVEQFGDAAEVEWGVIAEEIHELGLHWLVDYDDEGKPFGVRYATLALILIPALQNHEQRIAALEQAHSQ